MVIHKDLQRPAMFGEGTRWTTLCGRMNAKSKDGMNCTDGTQEVTCKFCLKLMARVPAKAGKDTEES